MANTKFLDPGGDATGNVLAGSSGGLWTTVNVLANVTASTSVVHGNHHYAIKVASTAATNPYFTRTGILADAGRRISFYLNIDTIPNANLKMNPVEIDTAALATSFGVTITSAGKLAIYNKTNAVVSTGATVLSTSTWYRICVVYTITSASVNTITVYLNGVSEVTATNLSATVSTSNASFGFSETVYGATGVNMYYSDIYVDDGTSGDTGDTWVTAKRPFSNGTSNQFTIQTGSGGSGYGTGHAPQVNERPLSTANGWGIGASTAATEEYTIEGKSVGDIDISTATIIDFIGWACCAFTTTLTVNKLIVAGVATTVTIGAGTNVVFLAAGSSIYPAGNTDIGFQATSGSSSTFVLYECGIMVAYIPGAVVVPNKGNFLAFM